MNNPVVSSLTVFVLQVKCVQKLVEFRVRLRPSADILAAAMDAGFTIPHETADIKRYLKVLSVDAIILFVTVRSSMDETLFVY